MKDEFNFSLLDNGLVFSRIAKKKKILRSIYIKNCARYIIRRIVSEINNF